MWCGAGFSLKTYSPYASNPSRSFSVATARSTRERRSSRCCSSSSSIGVLTATPGNVLEGVHIGDAGEFDAKLALLSDQRRLSERRLKPVEQEHDVGRPDDHDRLFVDHATTFDHVGALHVRRHLRERLVDHLDSVILNLDPSSDPAGLATHR